VPACAHVESALLAFHRKASAAATPTILPTGLPSLGPQTGGMLFRRDVEARALESSHACHPARGHMWTDDSTLVHRWCSMLTGIAPPGSGPESDDHLADTVGVVRLGWGGAVPIPATQDHWAAHLPRCCLGPPHPPPPPAHTRSARLPAAAVAAEQHPVATNTMAAAELVPTPLHHTLHVYKAHTTRPHPRLPDSTGLLQRWVRPGHPKQ